MGRINAAYLERKLRAAVGLVGGEQLQELGDVSSLITLESDRPEWALAGGELLLGVQVLQTLLAGQNSAVQLRNPPGSGILGIVERVLVTGDGVAINAVEMGILLNQPDLTTLVTTIIRDSRVPTLLGSGLRASRQNTAAGASQITRNSVSVNGVLEWAFPIVLGPGGTVRVTTVDLNVTMGVGFIWRERPIEGVFEIK